MAVHVKIPISENEKFRCNPEENLLMLGQMENLPRERDWGAGDNGDPWLPVLYP